MFRHKGPSVSQVHMTISEGVSCQVVLMVGLCWREVAQRCGLDARRLTQLRSEERRVGKEC